MTARTGAMEIFMFACNDMLIAYGITTTGDWKPPSGLLFSAAVSLTIQVFLLIRLAFRIG